MKWALLSTFALEMLYPIRFCNMTAFDLTLLRSEKTTNNLILDC